LFEAQVELLEQGPGSDCMLPRVIGDGRRLRKRVATVWRLSVDALAEEPPEAAQLFELCAFLHPERIPLALLVQLPEVVAQSDEYLSWPEITTGSLTRHPS
jgi:hypothetical protein